MPDEQAPPIVVDVANVLGSRPDGWWRDREGATRQLLGRLALLDDGHRLVCVLEGRARGAAPPGPLPGHPTVEVVHAPHAGDDTVASLAAPGRLVVTADRDLRARVQAAGAAIAGPRWLLDLVAAAADTAAT